jgi:probable HAF family extracellular repeat protein
MTDLGTLPQQTHSLGWGINSSGQVVGNSYTSGVGRAFLYSNGSMSDIGTLGGSNAFAQAINDVGQITGEAALANGTQNVFLYSGGQMIDLGKPGSGSAINNAGQIAGTANFGSGLHAFLYTGGQMMDLGTLLPGGFSSAEGINSLGHAVGFYEPQSGGRFVFRYANGQMTTLGSGVALGINSKGEVIGQEFVNSLGGFRARIYTDGQWTDLNQFIDPGSGWTLTDAEGINDLGQIVGSGVGPGGQLHGYLLTPIPEPAFVGLAALAVVALLRRR